MTVQATNYDGSRSYNLLQDSDIVNNLTSGGTSKVLSAEQGKMLNNKITNVAGKILQVGSVTCSYYSNSYLEGKIALQGYTFDVDKHKVFVTMRTVAGSAYAAVKDISYEGKGQNVTIWIGGQFVSGHLVNVCYMIVEKVGE